MKRLRKGVLILGYLPLSTVKWSGLKAKGIYWNDAVATSDEKEASYKADIYVLALLHHKETETLDILDLDQWSFYVLTKDQLQDISNDGSSVSLVKVEKHNIPKLSFKDLGPNIREL